MNRDSKFGGYCVACVVAVTVMALVALPLGCGQPSYLFLGQVYDPVRGCLARPTAIDVIAGDDPGRCPLECLEGPALTGGSGVITYVTSTCGPYPVLDAPSRSADCVAARAAFAQNSLCGADGGRGLAVDAGTDAR